MNHPYRQFLQKYQSIWICAQIMFPVYTESFEILHILINHFETMYQIIWVPAQIKFESLPDSCNSSNWFIWVLEQINFESWHWFIWFLPPITPFLCTNSEKQIPCIDALETLYRLILNPSTNSFDSLHRCIKSLFTNWFWIPAPIHLIPYIDSFEILHRSNSNPGTNSLHC